MKNIKNIMDMYFILVKNCNVFYIVKNCNVFYIVKNCNYDDLNCY